MMYQNQNMFQWSGDFSNNLGRFEYGICVDYSFVMHWHNEYELLYVYDGKYLFTVNERECELQAGEFAVVPKGESHKGEYLTPNTRILIIVFSEDQFSRASIEALKTLDVIFFTTSLYEELSISDCIQKEIANCIHKIGYLDSHRRPYSDAIAAQYLSLAIVLLASNLEPSASDIVRETKYCFGFNTIQMIRKATLYIENNYSMNISLDTLAALLSVSSCYLSHCFSSYIGKSFKQYLHYIRILHAKQRLIKTNKTVIEVAMECGFDNIRTFNRVFKNIVGMTPTEYRRMPANSVHNCKDADKVQ